MLVNPEEINIHKIKNEMLYDLKPSAAQPLPLPTSVNKSGRSSIARGLNLSKLGNSDFFTNDFNRQCEQKGPSQMSIRL